MNPWMAIIGAALGGVRASSEDSQHKREMRVENTRELWSPFTGKHGKDVANADYMGKVMEGANTGMAMGQQFPGKGGGGGKMAPTNAMDGQGATQGAGFDGGGMTMAQQNGAAGSAIDYGSPGASGYQPYAGPSQAPAYEPPGGAGLTDPAGQSSPGAQGTMELDPENPYVMRPKKNKPGQNVSSHGARNMYAR